MSTVLSPGDGYAIVCGLGLGFACVMILVSRIQTRYTHYNISNSEEFTSASRSVNPGMIAAGIVSAATWAATLLQSATVTYLYGISGCYWYGAGSVSQIMLFAQNAVMLKRHAPGAHTFLEPIRVRWGKWAHALFIFFGLGTNILLTAQLITGGADTITSLTGANVYAVCVLIPLTVVLYTMVGGLRATFFSDYAHTTLIFAIIMAFMFSAYATNAEIGSPSRMYDLLTEAGKNFPLESNAHGSYLTFRSSNGLVFGIIVVISGITTVFMDQTYWQRAVASRSSTSVKGYLWGGMAFMPVPWSFSTAVALGVVALTAAPAGSAAAAAQSIQRLTSPGLVAPVGAAALLGKSGATLLLVVLFLAVTSAASAELVAVSSIVVYDIYKPYFRPRATEKEVLWVTHATVIGYGIVMMVIGIIFYEIGISVGWLYGLTGVMFGCAVTPVGFAIRSTKANKNGCIVGAIVGFITSIIAWIVCAKEYYGFVNVTSTGGSYPQLAGNMASFFFSATICGVTAYLWPENYDFEITRTYNFAPEDITVVVPDKPEISGDLPAVEDAVVEAVKEARHDGKPLTAEKEQAVAEAAEREIQHEKSVDKELNEKNVEAGAAVEEIPINNVNDASAEELYGQFKYACIATGITFVIFIILTPTFAAIPKIWSKAGFTTWIVITFIYVFVAAAVVIIWPIWESRGYLAKLSKAIFLDLTGKGLHKV